MSSKIKFLFVSILSLSFLSTPLLLIPTYADEKQELPANPVCEHLKATAVTVKAKGGTGSGIVIVRGDVTYVLTAGHVVDANKTVIKEEGKPTKVEWEDVTVYQNDLDEGRIVGRVSYEAEVIRYSDAEHGEDLAILKLRKPKAFKTGITFYLGKQIPPVGTDLLHVGSLMGDFGANSVVPGFYSQHGRLVFGKIFDQLTCNAFPGSSGGAVTLKDGRYVGMVLRGASGGFILIAPVRRIKAWTDRIGMDFILDTTKKVPSEEDLKKHAIEECCTPMKKVKE